MKIKRLFQANPEFALTLLVIIIASTSAKSVKNSETILLKHKKPNQQQIPTLKNAYRNDLLRRLDYGQLQQQQNNRPNVPGEVQVSSNPIHINRFNKTPSTGNNNNMNRRHKRQILIQDATQYLASQGLLPQDQSTGQSQNYYISPQQIQDLSGLIGTPMPSFTAAQYPQAVTATSAYGSPVTVSPMPYSLAGTVAPQAQIYMLQPDGTSYAPLNAASFQQHPQQQQSIQHRTGEPSKNTPAGASPAPAAVVEQKPVQAQTVTVPESPPKPKVNIVHHANAKPEPTPEEKPETKSQQQQPQQQQQQVQQSQPVAAESNQEPSSIILPQGASTIIQATNPAEQQQLEQQYQLQQQQQAAQAQVVQLQQNPIPQPHFQSMLQPPPGQAYILQNGQAIPTDVLQNRQSQPHPQGSQPAHPSNFVIKPQTYVNNAGQMFTVPVPIPTDQLRLQSQHRHPHPHHHQSRLGEAPTNDQHHDHKHDNDNNNEEESINRHDNDGEQHSHEIESHHKEIRPMQMQTFMHRILDSFSMSRRTKERVEQNIYLPVLASSGVVLGLGALAAGWYLSQANREVGVLRRTGKPVTGGGPNVKRVRRNAPGPAEIDQAQFFQTIIQQAIEKQQTKFEDDDQLLTSSSENVPSSSYGSAPSPSYGPPSSSYGPSVNYGTAPGKKESSKHGGGEYDEVEHYKHNVPEKTSFVDHNHKEIVKHKHHHHKEVIKHHHHHYKPKPKKKKKHGLFSRQALNFARVAVPALIVGGSVLFIGGLILFWYLTGSNREIAFLEPSAYSRRRKRSLIDVNNEVVARKTTLMGDGWLQRLISSIHENPFEDGPPASSSSTNRVDMMINPGGAFDSSKYNSEADVSSAVVSASLAVIALLAMLALVYAWFLAEGGNAAAAGGTLLHGGAQGWPQQHSRKIRSVTNDLTAGFTSNPNFLEKILSNLEVSQNSILSKLQEVGYTKWQETPCAKRIFCDVMSSQSDDTVQVMEKRMATFISMLPSSFSSSLSKSLGDVMYSIQRKDCSAYTCGGHWVDPSKINQPSPPEPSSNHYQPRRRR